MSWAAQNDNPFEAANTPPPAVPAPAAAPAPPAPGGPAWLSSSAAAPPAAAPQAANGAADFTTQPTLPKGDPPKAVVYLRLVNLATATLTCVMGALTFLTSLSTGGDIAALVITMYVFWFGLMVCCFELKLKSITQYIAGNFGFFFHPYLRTIFLVFVGLLSFDATGGLFGILVGTALFVTATLNFYALWMFPEYIQPPAISEGQAAAMKQKAVGMAVNAAAQNPDLAKQAFTVAATSV